MNCDSRRVSSYHDGRLQGRETAAFEKHLLSCERCKNTLARYRSLSQAIKSLPSGPVPPSIRTDLWVRIAFEPLQSAPRWRRLLGRVNLVAAGAGALLVLLLTAPFWLGNALFQPRPVIAFSGASAIPANVPPNAVIQIQFDESMDSGAIEKAVQVFPSVEAKFQWHETEHKLNIIPQQEFSPNTTYTVRITRPPTPEKLLPAPPITFEASFTTAQRPSPPALPVFVAQPKTPTPSPQPRASVSPTPAQATFSTTSGSPVALAPVGAATPTPPSSTPTPTCSSELVRGFGKVYREMPAIASRLGCSLAQYQAITGLEQTFERGLMLARADNPQVYVLYQNDTWQVVESIGPPQDPDLEIGSDTPPRGQFRPARALGKIWGREPKVREAIGWATAKEREFRGAWQEFQRGIMVGIEAQQIYVLFHNGTWQQVADSYVDPDRQPTTTTVTPTASPANAPTATPTKTQTPTSPPGKPRLD